jgi:hypothetical protein
VYDDISKVYQKYYSIGGSAEKKFSDIRDGGAKKHYNQYESLFALGARARRQDNEGWLHGSARTSLLESRRTASLRSARCCVRFFHSLWLCDGTACSCTS